MKRKILFALFIGTTSLNAQDIDSMLVKEMPAIQKELKSQKLILDSLNSQWNNKFEAIQDKNASLQKKSDKQSSTIQGQKREIQSLVSDIEYQEANIDSLGSLIGVNSQNITVNSNQLGTEIDKVTTNTSTQISALDETIVQNRLYWIIASLGTLILGVLMYLFLGKRISTSKIDVESQLRNTKKSLEEESVKLDNKLVEILETQLKVKQEEIKTTPNNPIAKADHSLALKVADEIIRIQKNLGRMDEKTKGLKQLNSSVKRIQDNFASNGYELVEMIGKEYNEGMKVTVNFVQDDDFEDGKRIITRIIKPQVNFKGTMIQTAQIEVTES